MNLDDALQTFIAECRDLLLSMEDALLRIEQGPDDIDTINAIFRAAHTIKGSAGLFGLDGMVAFTHMAESVLDKVRSKELRVSPELVALLLQSGDHMSELVDHVAGGGELAAPVAAQGRTLTALLGAYLDEGPAAHAPPDAGHMPVEYALPHATQGGEVETGHWHLSLRFGRDVLKNGMDPLSFIRYLGTLGRIVRIVTLTGAMPPAASMDPECCYLGFEIGFKSQADMATIEGVFEFVREDCRVRILPPHSKISEYLALLCDMPQGQDPMPGDMLVRCGTLTQSELDTALQLQKGRSHVQGQAPLPTGEVPVGEHMVQSHVVEAGLEKQKQGKDSRAAEANLIRVDADKLDALIDLVGELIIAGAGASLAARRTGVPELLEATATLSHLVEAVRDSALDLRMVQIGGTFSRFQRVVRDVGRELGKDIELLISGADTELDKTVVERIGDPLTHLVRNAMDHGIEPAELRAARGKPASGTLQLNAFHDAGSIVIEVSDDGGGLNKERILQKALVRGLVNEGQALSDKEIHNLVFEAGFSTADAVSNLSGRGVGMDVVRRNIAALRGTVELDSVEGQGSTVRIRLPLTLAIIDGFLVGVGNAVYVIPLDMVVECMELGEVDHDGGSGKRYLNLRGEVLPYRRLREHFEVDGEPARRENIVVVRHGEHKAGLVVDRLMGEFQTVIKPLGKMFKLIGGIGGFTILGSGEVALILDVPGLMRQVMSGEEAVEQHKRALAPGR